MEISWNFVSLKKWETWKSFDANIAIFGNFVLNAKNAYRFDKNTNFFLASGRFCRKTLKVLTNFSMSRG